MSAHTPGPWRVGAMGYSHYQILTDNDAPLIVAVAHDPATARLIAAAPDLLEALKDLRDELASLKWGQPFPGRPHAMMDEADAAIAKATGEA